MKKSKHTQCLLQRGNEKQVTWIPSEFALFGTFVKLKSRGAEDWSDGWEVKETFNTLPSEQVTRMSDNHKNHRKATDV